jgi:hypothetical protein
VTVRGTIIAGTTTASIIINGALGMSSLLDVTVLNADSGTIYLGDSTVGTTMGFGLLPNAAISMRLFPDDILYGITPTGTVQVQVLLRGLSS